MPANKLPLHEWLVVGLIVLLMAGLILNTYRGDHAALPRTAIPHQLTTQEIRVTIEGAVVKPGTYTLPKGTVLNDLIALAEPRPDANLKGMKSKNRLKAGQFIHIPAQSLTIFVEGAVETPGVIEVPKGIYLQDLPNFIQLLPEADLKSLQKKRKLKDHEHIVVPSLKDR
jgi:hypothetical protein